MVKKIIRAFGGQIDNLHEAAYMLGFFAILAQILALFRDRLLAHYFGASEMLDIYYAAFRVPDLIFTTVASIVAGSVLIPFLQEKMIEGHENTKRLINEVWSSFAVVMCFSAIAAFFLMPALVAYLFDAMSAGAREHIVMLSRVLLLSPVFLGFSNFLSSIVQAHKRFALYALSPVLYNVGIIVGIIFLFPSFGISGVVMGVVIGAALHAFIQIPFARKVGLMPKVILPISFARMRSVAMLSLPRTLTLTSMNLVIIALVSLASHMTTGSISVFNFAYNLQTGPLSIIGVSYSMAAFPTLATLFASGHREKFANYVSNAFRYIIFWSIPATVLIIVIRAQIVRTVLGTGAFSWNDTRLTAACVAIFAISIVAQSANLLFIRAYYAAGKTKIPFTISAVSAMLTIVLAYLVYRAIFVFSPLQEFLVAIMKLEGVVGSEVLALPIAFTIGSLFNLWLFVHMFNKQFINIYALVRDTFVQGMAASVAAGIVSYLTLLAVGNIIKIDTLAGVFSQGSIAGLAGIAVWFGVLRLLKSREASEMISHVRSRIWKIDVVLPEKLEI